MIFRFTMNMASGQGRSVHQVIGGHPAKSCADLEKTLNNQDFITIEQFYLDKGSLTNKGSMVLNCVWIGKIDEFVPYPHGDDNQEEKPYEYQNHSGRVRPYR